MELKLFRNRWSVTPMEFVLSTGPKVFRQRQDETRKPLAKYHGTGLTNQSFSSPLHPTVSSSTSYKKLLTKSKEIVG